MTQYYKILDELDSEGMRKFFIETFIPQYVEPKIQDHRYTSFNHEFMKGELYKFEKSLEKYQFPKVAYFLVFIHYDDQPVHIDGHTEEPRYASLNLAISGYEGTKLNFYEADIEIEQIKTDARYIPDDTPLTCIDVLETNKWVLVNSGVLHNAVNIDPNNRRITVCFRFEGNPTFEEISRHV